MGELNLGDERICHTITINQDDVCEELYEDFFSDLILDSGVQPITVVVLKLSLMTLLNQSAVSKI